MSRYNHFAKSKYEPMNFQLVQVGQKFRMGRHSGKRRGYVIMIKTGSLSYVELKSNKEHTLYGNDFTVYKCQP